MGSTEADVATTSKTVLNGDDPLAIGLRHDMNEVACGWIFAKLWI